jgi:hypothetical protein
MVTGNVMYGTACSEHAGAEPVVRPGSQAGREAFAHINVFNVIVKM